jgi:hypothetical protein
MDRGRVGEDRGSKETDGCPLTLPVSSLKVIDIHLYSSLSLSPIALLSTPSSLVLPQHYSVYSITPSLPLAFYFCSLYVMVVDFKKSFALHLIVIIPSTLLYLLHFILQPM